MGNYGPSEIFTSMTGHNSLLFAGSQLLPPLSNPLYEGKKQKQTSPASTGQHKKVLPLKRKAKKTKINKNGGDQRSKRRHQRTVGKKTVRQQCWSLHEQIVGAHVQTALSWSVLGPFILVVDRIPCDEQYVGASCPPLISFLLTRTIM